MTRPRIKICCIASIEEARIAEAAGASLIGLVGAMPSGPGPIADERAAQIAAATPPGLVSVLLTEETTADAVVAHAQRVRPAAIQLVDACERGTIPALREALPGIRVLQVIHVEDEGALGQARASAEGSEPPDAILLDSGSPSAPVRELGGTGRTHDWSISARIVAECPLPVFLAGGLRPDNVAEAVARIRPFGLDLCTGVRTDGKLDPAKLAAFMEAAGQGG